MKDDRKNMTSRAFATRAKKTVKCIIPENEA